MKRQARIKRYFEARTGTNQRGETWVMQDIEIEWEEQEINSQPYEQRLVITLNRKIKEDLAKELIDQKKLINVTFYLDTHEYNNRLFNSIRGFIGREYTEDI